MLTQIYLESFKCFDTLSLPLAPLTLLTGFNAAGKSTVLQVPLLLAQALRGSTFGPRISLNGPLVQLGTISEVLNAGEERQLSVGVQSKEARILCRLGADERGTSSTAGIALVEIEDSDGQRSFRFSKGKQRDFLRRARRSSTVADLIDSIRTIVFISASRDGTREIFPSPEGGEPIHADVGVRGEFAPWWFVQNLDAEVPPERRHPSDPGTTLRRQVSAWAGELFSGAEADAQLLERTGLVQLKLRTRITDDWRRPANVGYGLAYAFPILVAGLLANVGQALIVDSPEAHLHPRAQFKMADFLATIASTGVQVILETHSDHVLNGIRLAVKRSRLAAASARIAYFHRDPTAQFVQVLNPIINEQGRLSFWPEGFFDQWDKSLDALLD